MIRLLRAALGTAAFAAGVLTGRQHERTCAFGTKYWRAETELALHLYDEPRLRDIQSRIPPAYFGRHRIEALAARTVDLLLPKSP